MQDYFDKYNVYIVVSLGSCYTSYTQFIGSWLIYILIQVNMYALYTMAFKEHLVSLITKYCSSF